MEKLIAEHGYRVQDDIPCCSTCANADVDEDIICTIYNDFVAANGICRDFSFDRKIA